ncbi:hypothetical protein VPH35_013581 [Triticum aestivum]
MAEVMALSAAGDYSVPPLASPSPVKAEPEPTPIERYSWVGMVREWVNAPLDWMRARETQERAYLEQWHQRRLPEERRKDEYLEQLERGAEEERREAEEEERRARGGAPQPAAEDVTTAWEMAFPWARPAPMLIGLTGPDDDDEDAYGSAPLRILGRASARAMGNSCVTGASSHSKKEQVQKAVEAPPSPVEQTTFKWTIDGFSSLLDLDKGWTISRVFEISGLRWYLRLNPRDTKSGDQNEYVSLRLQLSPASVRSDTVVEATYKFFIYDQLYGKHHEQPQVCHNFQTTSTSSGTSCMIPLATLKEKSSGFLVENSCAFGVEFIKVTAAQTNDATEKLFVQKKVNKISSIPEVYTWDIDDFFALKSPSHSPDFELHGHKWFISIHPSGFDKNGNFISVFLTMKVTDILHENSANLVELDIRIKSQGSGKDNGQKGRCEFSKNATSWGWDKFILLEDFKDCSNGYLVKTKCCIEAKVAVIGASKME